MPALRRLATATATVIAAAALAGCNTTTDPSPAPNRPGGVQYPKSDAVPNATLEVAHAFTGPQYPVGVAVSRTGRMFVAYPRWEDPVQFTVGEVRDGKEVAYPSQEMNSGENDPEKLFSAQSVVVDPADRLWVVDTGSVDMKPHKGPQWPKLVGIDLTTNKVFKTIHFPPTVAHAGTYLNDVRFDLRRGAEGTAYITDSSVGGPNGIIVVDLASGRSIRRLSGHPSTEADKTFAAQMEGEPMLQRKPGEPPKQALIGSDGIAVSADGSRVFYCPLSSRTLYSVDAAVLADPSKSDADVAATIRSEKRTFASDGLDADAQGRVYLTDWEHNAVVVRNPDGQFRTLVHDERLWWPDSLSIGADGYLYVSATQLHRQRKYHNGEDRRQRPFTFYKVKAGATPVTQTVGGQ
ncbi:MAG TPA: L-dopachrome tautomerase-related protein [Humisphaera sp.]